MSEQSDKKRYERVRVLEDKMRNARVTNLIPNGDAILAFCAYKAAARGNAESVRLAGYTCTPKSQTNVAYRLLKRPDIIELIRLYQDGYLSDIMSETDAGIEVLTRLETHGNFNSIAKNMLEELIRDDYNIAMGAQGVFSFQKNDRGEMVLIENDMREITPEERRRITGYKKGTRQVFNENGKPEDEIYIELTLQDPSAAKGRLLKYLGADKMMVELRNESDTEKDSPADKLVAKLAAFAERASASGSD